MKYQVNIRKTAQIETWGNPQAKNVIVVLHGYGQLVKYFIRKFHDLNEDDYFVIAPEGLHRFYLKGASGRVGASWMTKEERETDIKDYIKYLDDVCEQFKLNQYNNRILLGFSQGGATASRWHELGDFLADQFILWGSVFPSDVELPEKTSKFQSSKNHFLIGDKDEYYHESAQEQVISEIKKLDLNFNIHRYEGSHNIYIKELLKLID